MAGNNNETFKFSFSVVTGNMFSDKQESLSKDMYDCRSVVLCLRKGKVVLIAV
jgi:hypothetical protein